MSISPGARLGPYEILAPIGSGGMGEVWKARDTKLDRNVAVKVLPQSVAADSDALARFEREAKAVAALSHPNILAIHDFGSHDGIAYAVMELLEGETLRGRLDAGPITQKQAVDYALQAAKGLSAAHEKGIVHRDLKPENLFISRDGHLKILDFGLAKKIESVAPGKETSAPTGSGHTEPGTVMGTAGYMSPEQVKGFAVDHRSDIFSFGTILYELLSGKKAFKRDTNAETMAAILRDEPQELSGPGRTISPALDRVVQHCLEKDRERRFQSARDIVFSLSEQSTPSPTSGSREIVPPISSDGLRIAVMPFKSGDADSDLAALADGLSEEIVTGLSRFRYLSVVASESAHRLKGDAGDERVVGVRLGARYVLEGSVRKGGSAIRVSAQLVDTQTGAKLWAETYNQDLQTASLFAVQDDVAARIVATVGDSYGVLVHSMRSAVRQKDDVHLTPVEWQFQYFAYREQITPSAYAELKSRLERAVERDGRQSDLWACLAQIFVDEYAFGFGTDPAALDRALAAARRAVELDRANQFALVALAQTHFFRQDLAAFGPAAERAMALNPLNTDAVGILGLQIVHTGEFERGAKIVRRAMELNANHAGWMHFAPLWEHFHRGEYEQALERANRVDVPGLFWPYLVVAAACGHLRRRAEAEAAVRDLLALDPEFAAHARSNVGTWHFASGLMHPILEGLRKAGLSISEADGSPGPPKRAGSDRNKSDRAESRADSGQIRAGEGFWVAVLQFKYSGADRSLTTLAEGLTEEIVTGLSRFSYLRVISRSSAADATSAGKDLGARYVMEGSLRQAGSRLRITAQLVDATSGAHLWAETYDRPFEPETVFDLQDDLVPRIVSTVADMNGVLPRSMSETARSRAPEELSPYEAVLRSFGYFERVNAEELVAARSGLESAVEKAPGYADAWAMLALLCVQEHAQGFNLQADCLTNGAIAARRAVEATPSNHLAHFSLAQALFFQKEFQSFRHAAERTVALNPMDGNSIAFLGELLTYAGDWERGMALAERAKQLNPHHPGWYWYADFYNAYRQGDYRGALDFALKANLPSHWGMHAAMAAAYGQLGELDAAGKALRALLKLRPDFAETLPGDVEKWWKPDYGKHFTDGLRKAGLQIAGETTATPQERDLTRSSTTDSGAERAEEGFWIAVLPFRYAGTAAEVKALTDGLSEEIVTGLSRFSYLRVIARGSTAKYSSEASDIRAIGKELGARYVMEGSVREAGAKLRLAVQLVDTMSGVHIWAENYERTFAPEAVFELQDDLVPRIVSTIADQYGALVHSMSESLRGRSAGEYSPHEAVLRAFGYWERVTVEEHREVREILEAAVDRAPDHSDCLAELSLIYWHEHAFGYNLRPDPLGRARAAAHRAVASAPTSHFAHCALATGLFFQRNFPAFRSAAERALALNRMDASTNAILGTMIAYAGDWEYGLGVMERAMQLNPHHPGWYHYVVFTDAYRRRDYRRALASALKVNMPGYHWPYVLLAVVYGQLGEQERARAALREVHALLPDFGAMAREEFGKWHDPELTEHLLDGLRKAGLEISASAETGLPAPPEALVAIAVLPFVDMSPAKDQEYLCEGMAEEIMNALVRVDGIRVASRTSAFRAQKDGGELSAIARSLSVNHVLEGSVRTSGSRLRVTARLTDVASGYQVWSERFDREAIDVFAIQDEIAAGVVDAVKTRLAPGEHSVPARPQPANLEAYRSYLMGRHLRGKEHHVAALHAFEEAVRLDPSYAPSWTGLAEVTVLASVFGLIPARDACETARKALATATRLQGESADGLHVEGFVAWVERRWAAMEVAWRRAIELQPTHVLTLASFGIVLCTRQRLDEALPFLERARQADPLSSFPYALTGGGLLSCGRPQEALRYLEDALSFEKEDATALDNAGIAKVALGRFEEGIATLEHVVAVSQRGAHFLGTLGWALATAGRTGEARTILEELRARPPGSPAVVSEAWLLGALGEVDRAFEVVARADDERLAYLYFTGLPTFDSLRADPRFDAVLERLGLPSASRAPS